MLKWLRIVAGSLLIASLLGAAQIAVRDCATGPYSFDNCTWVWLRAHLSLPQSRILRTLALESVGLGLLAGIFVSIRYLLPPFRKVPRQARDDGAPAVSTSPQTPPKPSDQS